MAGSEHEGEAAALAEPDHADPARAVVPLSEPGARGVEVAEWLRFHPRSRCVARARLSIALISRMKEIMQVIRRPQ